jgi:hypothetical protein
VFTARWLIGIILSIMAKIEGLSTSEKVSQPTLLTFNPLENISQLSVEECAPDLFSEIDSIEEPNEEEGLEIIEEKIEVPKVKKKKMYVLEMLKHAYSKTYKNEFSVEFSHKLPQLVFRGLNDVRLSEIPLFFDEEFFVQKEREVRITVPKQKQSISNIKGYPHLIRYLLSLESLQNSRMVMYCGYGEPLWIYFDNRDEETVKKINEVSKRLEGTGEFFIKKTLWCYEIFKC